MSAVKTHRPAQTGTRVNERGSVLIIVMWISMVLITVAIYFAQAMTVEYRASANGAGDTAAAQAVEGVRRYLSYTFEEVTMPGDYPSTEEVSFEDLRVGDASVWLVGRGYNAVIVAVEPTFGLVAENAKLDLNVATAEMFNLLPDIPEGLAERIIDWRDEDEELTEGGAESQDYLLADPSYYAKNADFETVEELRFVLMGDWDYFLGEDTNHNGVLDPNEDDGDATPPNDNQDGILNPGILEFVTIYNREPTTLSDGTERIDVTSGNANQAIRGILEENLDESRADEIMGSLRNQTFTSVLAFYAASGMDASEFELIDAYLYQPNPLDQNPVEGYVRGLINVNRAPEAVLTCVLQDDTLAAALVSYRDTLDVESLNSVAWVADALEGDQGAIQAIGPLITGNCFVYTADLAGVGKHGRGFARIAYVLDTSGESVVVLHRRDRGRLGWPLGETVRIESRSPTEGRNLFR